MDFLESDIHSFIVKIWLEERSEETGQPTWCGHITHVPDNHRSYFKNLEEINIFIVPYLRKMGVKSDGQR
jgi:hypothetical protein